MQIRMLINPRCEVAEVPLWDEREKVLYWVSILDGEIHRLDERDGSHQVYPVGEHIGTFAMRERGGMITALKSGFAYFDPTSGQITPIANPEAAVTGNRFNDGKACPKGNLWAGTMAYSLALGAGSLYRLTPEGDVTTISTGLCISNGLAWSLDERTMYHIDTIPGIVYAFDYDRSSGDAANRRELFRVPSESLGNPDGMTLDHEGMLWIAHFGGGCVRRWNPNTGAILETITLPTQQITSCVFGGEHWNTLYITSAWEHMSEEQKARDPLAGALFAVDLPVHGMPLYRYAG